MSEIQTITKSEIRYIYKFKEFDEKGYYKTLLQNKLYFSSAKNFNDPFDSTIPIRYDLLTKAEHLQFLIEALEFKYPKMRSSEIRKKSKQISKHQSNDQLKNIKYIKEINKNWLYNHLGIFSFTEKLNNLLLWAHYTDAHQGFCVEFDAQQLDKFLVEKALKLGFMIILCKVTYSTEYPAIHPNEDKLIRLQKQVLTKSEDWGYEDEWRILYAEGVDKIIEIPSGIVTKIYFGINASEPNIAPSINILKISNPTIQIYKAKPKTGQFGLDFEKISS